MLVLYLLCIVFRIYYFNLRKFGICEVVFINVKFSVDVDV